MIGEAPGVTENTTGVPFTGTSGRILDTILSFVQTGFTYIITNVVGCQPCDPVYDSTPSPDTLDLSDPDSPQLDMSSSTPDYIDFPDLDSPSPLNIVSTTNLNRTPTQKELEACSPHLKELVTSFGPRAVINLGKVAATFQTRLPTLNVMHPAAIARMEYKLLAMKKEARKIDTFLTSLNRKGVAY